MRNKHTTNFFTIYGSRWKGSATQSWRCMYMLREIVLCIGSLLKNHQIVFASIQLKDFMCMAAINWFDRGRKIYHLITFCILVGWKGKRASLMKTSSRVLVIVYLSICNARGTLRTVC